MPQSALAILSGALLAFYGNQLPDPSWSAYLPLLLLLACFCPRYRFLCLLGASFLWCAAAMQHHLSHRLQAEFDNRTVLLTAKIADLPTRGVERTGLLLSQVHIDRYPPPMPRLLRLNWYQTEQLPTAGETWQFLVHLKQPRGRLNSAGLDFEAWQFVLGVDGAGYVVNSQLNRRLGAASAFDLDRLRAGLADNIDRACEHCRQRGLIKALTLGYRGDMERGVRDLLQSTGTAHLLAISGLHIGMVAMLFYALGRACWRAGGYRLGINRRGFASLLAILAAFAYAALAGFSLPTVRALIMLVVVLLGQQVNQRINLLQSMALALMVILLIDPLAVGSASFWLSFGALLVIGLAQFRLPRPLGGWQQLVLVQCFFVLLFAPPGMLIFGQLNVAGLPANLVAIPALSFLILPLVLIAGLLSPLSTPGAAWLFAAADRLLDYLVTYLGWLLSIGLHSRVAASLPPLLALLTLAALVLILLPRLPGVRVVALAILGSLLLWLPPRLEQGEFELRVLDVGMGSSMLLRTRHHSLVYDFGPGRKQVYSAADQALIPVMHRLGIETPDLLIVSHVDQDHSGGLHSFTGRYQPAQLLSGTPRELQARFQLPHRVRSCHAYPPWRWDGVRFRFLDIATGAESTNDRSCILLVSGHHRLLLPGDIESAAEEALIESWGDQLAADVLLAPHHGSDSSSSQRFIDRVAADQVVFTLARNNRWGFPQAAVLARYRAQGATLYRSDRDGEIRIHSQARRLRITTQRGPPRRIWRRW